MPEERWMERIVFSCVAVALIGLGICMVLWPAWVMLKSRDEDDNGPLTSRAIRTTRVVGVGIVLGGGYGLYAILTGIPGSDILTP
jgi:hypothetical protein